MKKNLHLATLLLLLFGGSAVAQDNVSALMPMVNKVVQLNGVPLNFNKEQITVQINSPELMFASKVLQNSLQTHMGITPVVSNRKTADIELTLDRKMKGKEHYTLHVKNNIIEIKGASKGAVLYGVMTLEQILIGDYSHTKNREIAQVFIDDQPRFPFRGLMIDPARNFLPVEDVKFFIDQMALYKFNVLQIHLTDDQGWRMEIKAYPELTRLGKYYTQKELQEIIEYADERNIEVIPELDIPGHVSALLASYPDLGCTHMQNQPIKIGTTVNRTLCASNERVYQVYKDIIGEVADLFPSKKIHLGGDEARIEENWAQCEQCKEMMQKLNYTESSQLMIPFFNRMNTFVKENNKELLLWCELDSERAPASRYLFPYAKDITLITWRLGLTETCLELTAKNNHPIIMAPGEYAYLDYPQLKGDLPEFNNWGMPVTTLEKCYQFDPGYGLTDNNDHIQGVLGTLWAEAMKDINRVTYMAFPRAMALSEAGWTQMHNRGWESFVSRMYPNIDNLMKNGVSVRVPFEIVKRK